MDDVLLSFSEDSTIKLWNIQKSSQTKGIEFHNINVLNQNQVTNYFILSFASDLLVHMLGNQTCVHFVHSKAQPVVVGYSYQPVISLDHARTYGNK